jgi:hypothetical protein
MFVMINSKAMKSIRHTFIFMSILGAIVPLHAQNNTYSGTSSSSSLAFKRGEKLEYRVHYGLINAGTAEIEISEKTTTYKNRSVLHAIGTGKSNSFFDFFFKVRDRYESIFDENSLKPIKFVRRVNEGGYKIEQDYIFDPEKDIVDNGKGNKYKLPYPNVQDMISAFYYVRSFDFSQSKIGDVYDIPTFLDNEVYHMKMKFMGTDTIEVDKGTFSCYKFVPVVQKGRIFKQEEDLMVWVTKDKNHIPVLAQAKVLVGSIRMDLVDYEGLAHPVAKID